MALSLICAMSSRKLAYKRMGTSLMRVYQWYVYNWYIRGHEFTYKSPHWFRIFKINQMCALLTFLRYIRIYFYGKERSCGEGGVGVRVVRPPVGGGGVRDLANLAAGKAHGVAEKNI